MGTKYNQKIRRLTHWWLKKLSFINAGNDGATDREWEMNKWVDRWVEADGDFSFDNPRRKLQ